MRANDVNQRLDRAVSQMAADDDTRLLCLHLARHGSDAQAVRAIAVLALVGAQTPPFLPSILAGLWPKLPKSEAEVRALMNLTKRDPSLLRSFMAALIANVGPPEKIRQKLFAEYMRSQPHPDELSRLAGAITAVTQPLKKLGPSISRARRRLLRFSSMVLKTQRKQLRASSPDLLVGTTSLFGTLGHIYALDPKPSAEEASALVTLLIDHSSDKQIEGQLQKFQELWSSLPDAEILLRSGWELPRLQKTERLRRENFAFAVMAYACTADTGSKQKFARSLLSLILPREISTDHWLSEARARLALMQLSTNGEGDLGQLVQTLRESTLDIDVSISAFQDMTSHAVRELVRLLRRYEGEVRLLRREIDHLKQPETIQARAGDLVREELARQTGFLAKLQEHFREKKSHMASHLKDALQRARQGESGFHEIENVIKDVIAFLEERS